MADDDDDEKVSEMESSNVDERTSLLSKKSMDTGMFICRPIDVVIDICGNRIVSLFSFHPPPLLAY